MGDVKREGTAAKLKCTRALALAAKNA